MTDAAVKNRYQLLQRDMENTRGVISEIRQNCPEVEREFAREFNQLTDEYETATTNQEKMDILSQQRTILEEMKETADEEDCL